MSGMREKLLAAAAQHVTEGEYMPLWYTDKGEVLVGERGYASRRVAIGVANRRGNEHGLNAYAAQRTASKVVIWSGTQTTLCKRDL